MGYAGLLRNRDHSSAFLGRVITPHFFAPLTRNDLSSRERSSSFLRANRGEVNRTDGSVHSSSEPIRRISRLQPSVVGRGVASERRGLLLLVLLVRPEVAVESAVDADAVVLLLLHGAVVGRLGEAEVVVGPPLAPRHSGGGHRPRGAGLVQLPARAVRAVEVGADQIWPKALLKRDGFISDRESIMVCGEIRLLSAVAYYVQQQARCVQLMAEPLRHAREGRTFL